MFCPSCGKEVDEGGKFCSFCGYRLDEMGETEAQENTQKPEKTVSPYVARPSGSKKPGNTGNSEGNKEVSQKKKSSLPVIIGAIVGALVLITIPVLLFVFPGFLRNEKTEEAVEAVEEQTVETETAKTEDAEPDQSETESAEKDEEADEEAEKEEELDRSEYIYFRPVIEEEELVNYEKVKITAKELHADGESGDVKLIISIKNNTDKKITVVSKEGYVNGLLTDTAMAANVDSGETKDTELFFRGYSVRIYGIEKIAEMEFDLSVTDAETYEELFSTEPVSVKTDLYGTFEQEYYDFGDLGAVNIRSEDEETAKGITSNFVDYYPKGELVPEASAMVFYVQNNTKNDYSFTSTDIKVNGETVTGYVDSNLRAGHKGMLMFQVVDPPEEIEDIELDIGIYKGTGTDKGEKIGHFGVLYNPDMEQPEETAERFSTDEDPTDDDFIYFCKIIDELSEKRKVNYDHEAYSGGYKAFLMIYDDANENVIKIRYLKAGIETQDDKITVTLHPISEYDIKKDKTKDISKEDDMEFTGKWNADDDFTADGSGTIDMAIISTDDGQFALGEYIYPTGEKAELGFMRP